MKLTKQQKTLLGVGAVAVAAYLIWQQTQKKKEFMGLYPLRSRSNSINPQLNEFLQNRATSRPQRTANRLETLSEMPRVNTLPSSLPNLTPLSSITRLPSCRGTSGTVYEMFKNDTTGEVYGRYGTFNRKASSTLLKEDGCLI